MTRAGQARVRVLLDCIVAHAERILRCNCLRVNIHKVLK
jgi:hypothetical protein